MGQVLHRDTAVSRPPVPPPTIIGSMPASTVPRELADGATAIVRGALDAGCTFFAGYPITPASSILTAMMRELPKAGGVAIQRSRS